MRRDLTQASLDNTDTDKYLYFVLEIEILLKYESTVLEKYRIYNIKCKDPLELFEFFFSVMNVFHCNINMKRWMFGEHKYFI